MQWIKFLSTTEGVCIQHARNGGEKEIGPYKVDDTTLNLTESSGTDAYTVTMTAPSTRFQRVDHLGLLDKVS
jgi:hypothetical protein